MCCSLEKLCGTELCWPGLSNSLAERYISHMFVPCGVHVAREEGIPLRLPAVFSCQICRTDFSVWVPGWSQLSSPLTCLSSHRYWHYHEGCGAVTTEGLRVLDGETSLLLPAHHWQNHSEYQGCPGARSLCSAPGQHFPAPHPPAWGSCPFPFVDLNTWGCKPTLAAPGFHTHPGVKGSADLLQRFTDKIPSAAPYSRRTGVSPAVISSQRKGSIGLWFLWCTDHFIQSYSTSKSRF